MNALPHKPSVLSQKLSIKLGTPPPSAHHGDETSLLLVANLNQQASANEKVHAPITPQKHLNPFYLQHKLKIYMEILIKFLTISIEVRKYNYIFLLSSILNI